MFPKPLYHTVWYIIGSRKVLSRKTNVESEYTEITSLPRILFKCFMATESVGGIKWPWLSKSIKPIEFKAD